MGAEVQKKIKKSSFVVSEKGFCCQNRRKGGKNGATGRKYQEKVLLFQFFFVSLQPLFASCDGGLSKTT